jgi:hypothetical protein
VSEDEEEETEEEEERVCLGRKTTLRIGPRDR